jgi:hypothetical protein
MKKVLFIICFILYVLNVNAAPWIDIEGGAVFTGYNDVQIPSDTGTRFSLKNDITQKTEPFYRIQIGYRISERHDLFALYAPLTVEGKSRIDRTINFQGKTFTSGTEVSSKFRFDSYRLTYTYTFYASDSLILAAGITGKIRDAEITLSDSSGSVSRKNTGFVPLAHFSLEWFFINNFSFLIDGDGLAAPQGRAEDFLFAFNYYFDKQLNLKAGYRILEGGSDGGGDVYTFSMFHYIVYGAQYRL